MELSEQRESFKDCIKTSRMYGHAFKSPAEKRKIDNEVGDIVCVCVRESLTGGGM